MEDVTVQRPDGNGGLEAVTIPSSIFLCKLANGKSVIHVTKAGSLYRDGMFSAQIKGGIPDYLDYATDLCDEGWRIIEIFGMQVDDKPHEV